MAYLGLDTSNYTTSVALWHEGEIVETRRLLPVPKGNLGLRQSDAVFAHVKALSALVKELNVRGISLEGIGASIRPREQEGSYMPCFLVGQMVGEVVSELLDIPFVPLAHQTGHIAAALYGAERLDLLRESFVSLHISGGTTECVHVEDLLLGKTNILSATMDLNAGQLVDRVGAMLGLEFPAGKALDEMANRGTKFFKVHPTFKEGNPCISGIENTAKRMMEQGFTPEDVARFVIIYIETIVEIMAKKGREATGLDTVVFAGGVMSNSMIRRDLGKKKGFVFTKPQCSADNAMGIALLTACKLGAI